MRESCWIMFDTWGDVCLVGSCVHGYRGLRGGLDWRLAVLIPKRREERIHKVVRSLLFVFGMPLAVYPYNLALLRGHNCAHLPPSLPSQYSSTPFVYTDSVVSVHFTTVVHLPRVHQLLAPPDGDGLRVRLVQQQLVHGLDRVHRVLGPRHPRRDVVDARGAAHLEEAVGHAQPEACYNHQTVRKASQKARRGGVSVVCVCVCVSSRTYLAGAQRPPPPSPTPWP